MWTFVHVSFSYLFIIEIISTDVEVAYISIPSSIPNASTQANANRNHGAVSKITLKGPLQLSLAFYQWGNQGANMWKFRPMLHK